MKTIFSHRPDSLWLRRASSLRGLPGVWLPVAIAIAIISFESTPTMGGDHTSSWLRPIFERLFGHFSDEHWNELHHLIRKTGHFIGYGLVCLTFLRAWLYSFAHRASLSLAAWRFKASSIAILSTAIVASLDEWHQTFLPNRTGRWQDVLLDTCGASALCLLIWLLFWRRPAS